jgi:hypothetical protein
MDVNASIAFTRKEGFLECSIAPRIDGDIRLPVTRRLRSNREKTFGDIFFRRAAIDNNPQYGLFHVLGLSGQDRCLSVRFGLQAWVAGPVID